MVRLAIVLLLVSCGGATKRSAMLGQQFDFMLPTLAGGQLAARDLRGSVVLLDVWATWCVPCKESLPFYQALAEQHRARGFRIVAVSVDSDAAAVKRFVAQHALAFDVLLDPAGSLAERIDVPAMPTLLLIDREGKVIWQHAGFKARDKATIKERIDAAL